MDDHPTPHTARVVSSDHSTSTTNESNAKYKAQVDVFIMRGWTPRELLHEYIRLLEQEINAYRCKHGLAGVEVDTRLCIAAARQNFDICFNQRGRAGHMNACGECLGSRMRAVGYDFGYCTEVVWRGGEHCAEVVQGWMGSRECRDRVLSRDARDVGMHCGRGVDGVMYWTVVFGQTRTQLFHGMDRREMVRYAGRVMRRYQLGLER